MLSNLYQEEEDMLSFKNPQFTSDHMDRNLNDDVVDDTQMDGGFRPLEVMSEILYQISNFSHEIP